MFNFVAMDHHRNTSYPPLPSMATTPRDRDRDHDRDHDRDRDRYVPHSHRHPVTGNDDPPNAQLALRLPVPHPSASNHSHQHSQPTIIAVQQPTEIAHFSYDSQGRFLPDRSSLRFWSPPAHPILPCARVSDPRDLAEPLSCSAAPSSVPEKDRPLVDLNSAFDQYDPNDGPGIEPLDNLLRGLVAHGVWSYKDGGAPGISVVTWRGILTKLLVAPYNDRDSWELGMVKHKSTLFVHEHITPDRRAQESATQQDPRRARMAYWGYRFEHLCTLASPPSSLSRTDLEAAHQQRTHTPLDAKRQFCSVVKTKIGTHRVIVGAEVDCCRDPGPHGESVPRPLPHYMELKTHRLAPTSGGGRAGPGWRAKLLRIWAQSFLAGIPTVMVGFRDDARGEVRAVRQYRTLELPRGARGVRGGDDAWDPNVCIRFAALALDHLVRVAAEHAEGVEFLVRYKPRERLIEVFKHAGQRDVGAQVWENGRPGGVLPEWFKVGDPAESQVRGHQP